MDTSEDQSYAEAAPLATGQALGRTFAGIYLGMVGCGMDEDDALAILTEYVASLVANGCDHGDA